MPSKARLEIFKIMKIAVHEKRKNTKRKRAENLGKILNINC